MSFEWLKVWMPRSLYGRAALILLLPIVVIQLVVSIMFLQRHFEDVTQQMTRNVVLEIQYLLETRPVDAERAAGLGIAVMPAEVGAAGDRRRFYDISGRTVIATLRTALDGVESVDLAADRRRVKVVIARGGDPLQLTFERRRVSASNPHQLLVLMIFTSVLMTLIAYLFLRNQLRPIRRLARASEAFGKGQRLDYTPAGAQEVRAAGGAFLDMRNRIERQIEQRTLMLSGVSHDLRTPLTRLKLGLQLMEADDVSELVRDVDDMEALLEAFLEFARGDAGETPEPLDPVALSEAVAEGARRIGHSVAVEGDAGTILTARPLALKRALINLVSNATRYGTEARIRVTAMDRSVVFSVEDNGPGIPEAGREEAVKAFARLDAARNQDGGAGVGLGLAIATDILRAHGGHLRLGESADLGGLQVDLVLPQMA